MLGLRPVLAALLSAKAYEGHIFPLDNVLEIASIMPFKAWPAAVLLMASDSAIAVVNSDLFMNGP